MAQRRLFQAGAAQRRLFQDRRGRLTWAQPVLYSARMLPETPFRGGRPPAAPLDFEISRLEDLSRQREATLAHTFTYSAYGYPVHFATDDPLLLEVAHISAGCFSRCEPVPDATPTRLKFFLDPGLPAEPLPVDLSSRLRYVMVGQRLAVHAPPWVSTFVDLREWAVVAVVSPAAVRQAPFLSRYVCDNFVFHILMRTWMGHIGHLHASCLYRDGRAVLLSAPHNAGKSTAALRLMTAGTDGYRLVTDSTTLARIWDRGAAQRRLFQAGVELLGYPVGQLKLRTDVLDEFPELKAHGRSLLVRNELKIAINLRQEMPERIVEESVWPREIVLCQIERVPGRTTSAEPREPAQVLREIWPESAFVDDPEVNDGNRAALETLLERARCYRLRLGSDVPGLLATVERL